MNGLKKMTLSCLIFVLSISLVSSISVQASEGDVTSEVTIGFSEKTLKDDKKKEIKKETKTETGDTKSKPSITNKADGNDNSKKYYSALPKTGEILNSPFIYVGLVLILSALAYKVYTKKERR